MGKLNNIVKDLISKGREWQYWDYKSEWYTPVHKADFIHDILCMSNVNYDGDRYIILGLMMMVV